MLHPAVGTVEVAVPVIEDGFASSGGIAAGLAILGALLEAALGNVATAREVAIGVGSLVEGVAAGTAATAVVVVLIPEVEAHAASNGD